MHSPVAKLVFRAALLALPLAASAQLSPAPVDRTANLTLLPGPTLTSPHRSVTADAVRSGSLLSPEPMVEILTISNARDGRGKESAAERIADQELRAAQEKLTQAEARVEALRAERDAVLARKKSLEDNRPANPPSGTSNLPRFDSKIGPVPNPLKMEGPIQRSNIGTKP